ncbi:hypothetical protein MXB_2379 [Myxobolus squamalis]|nr:hypothetical protein MXB_2379 [Myxobolus squamalis]
MIHELMIMEESFFEEQNKKEELNQFEAKKMAECVNRIENGLAGFKAQHPDPERFEKVSKAVNDAIACYTIIYEKKKRPIRQTTLDKDK